MTAGSTRQKETPEERAEHIRALMEQYAQDLAVTAPPLTERQKMRLFALLNTP